MDLLDKAELEKKKAALILNKAKTYIFYYYY